MKQLLYILLGITLFTACSSDDDNEPIQTYTSFVFHQTVDIKFPNCVAAHKRDGKFFKIADLGELSKDKYSAEITIKDQSISEIYFFTDYISTRRADKVFYIKKNIKNTFDLTSDIRAITVTDKTDPTQYPQ